MVGVVQNLAENAGNTSRITQMIDVLNEYEKKEGKTVKSIDHNDNQYVSISSTNFEEENLETSKFIDDENITFQNVSIYTPTERLLTKNLNATIKHSQHLIIQGP